MNESVGIFVQIVKHLDDRWTQVKLKLQDGTEAEFMVEKHSLAPIEKANPPAAWLDAICSGEQNGLASVELPQPILNYGRRVTLKTEVIKRRSLEEIVQKIKPQSQNKGISPR